MRQFTFSSGLKTDHAPRVLVYGVEGIGKSSFAAKFPDPLFIDTERSTAFLDVQRFDPAPISWQELLDMVSFATAERAPGSTLVIDTLDWAEKLCIESTCSENGWTGIEAPKYGSGYRYVFEKFGKLLNALNDASDRGINIVCTAHARLSKFEQPDEAGAYDKWGLKLIDSPRTSIANLCKEWADTLLFANYKTIVEQVDGKKFKARGNKRVMYTEHNAIYDAKNRWGLPPELPFDYASIAQCIPNSSYYGAQSVPAAPQNEAQQALQATPQSMPTIAQPSPQTASGGFLQLMSLMEHSGITEAELKMAVASQGYVTIATPLSNYPEDLVNYLVAKFDAVRATVEDQRQDSVPFN